MTDAANTFLQKITDDVIIASPENPLDEQASNRVMFVLKSINFLKALTNYLDSIDDTILYVNKGKEDQVELLSSDLSKLCNFEMKSQVGFLASLKGIADQESIINKTQEYFNNADNYKFILDVTPHMEQVKLGQVEMFMIDYDVYSGTLIRIYSSAGDVEKLEKVSGRVLAAVEQSALEEIERIKSKLILPEQTSEAPVSTVSDEKPFILDKPAAYYSGIFTTEDSSYALFGCLRPLVMDGLPSYYNDYYDIVSKALQNAVAKECEVIKEEEISQQLSQSE